MKRVVTNEPNLSCDVIDDDCSDDDWDMVDDHGIMDPYVTIRAEDIESIDGKTDENGLPFGKCAVTLRNGDDLFGSWRAGRRLVKNKREKFVQKK